MPKQVLELECPFCGTSHDHETYSKSRKRKSIALAGRRRRCACSRALARATFASANGASVISQEAPMRSLSRPSPCSGRPWPR